MLNSYASRTARRVRVVCAHRCDGDGRIGRRPSKSSEQRYVRPAWMNGISAQLLPSSE